MRPHLNGEKAGCVVHACHSIMVESLSWPTQSGTPIYKTTRLQRTGSVAQVAEVLPHELKVLSSNSSTAKKLKES
jgi:hypothetical protein